MVRVVSSGLKMHIFLKFPFLCREPCSARRTGWVSGKAVSCRAAPLSSRCLDGWSAADALGASPCRPGRDPRPGPGAPLALSAPCKGRRAGGGGEPGEAGAQQPGVPVPRSGVAAELVPSTFAFTVLRKPSISPWSAEGLDVPLGWSGSIACSFSGHTPGGEVGADASARQLLLQTHLWQTPLHIGTNLFFPAQ